MKKYKICLATCLSSIILKLKEELNGGGFLECLARLINMSIKQIFGKHWFSLKGWKNSDWRFSITILT